MISAQTERAARLTLDALAAGARAFVTRPSGDGSAGRDAFRDQLLPRVRVLGHARRQALAGVAVPPVARPASPLPPLPRAQDPIRLVVVASGTGGPNALADLVTSVPADFPVPILVVQHMPPVFTRVLAERLQARCRVPVREATGGEALAGAGVFIAPGDHHLTVVREDSELRLRLSQQPPENSCRPAADVLFRSAAAAAGSGALAVVMTGLGQDGMRGAGAIRAAGGAVLAQDEASSLVWGMPGAIVHAGLADEILPLDRLGPFIARRARRRAATVKPCNARHVTCAR